VRFASAAWLALVASACSGGISPDDLPSDPIAFIRQSASEGILSREQFLDALRFEDLDKPSTKKARLKTTLTLLAPTTGVETVVPEGGLGSVPFDWSTDGTHLLVGRTDPSERSLQLYTWNRITGAWTRVVRTPVGSGAGMAAGPIRFVWHGPQVQGRTILPVIWIETDERGSSVLPGSQDGIEPDVSPDGRTVVFARPEGSGVRAETVFAFTLGDAGPRALARGSHPRYSRDGRWISFTRVSAGQSDVWIMRADGTAKRRVTKTGYDEEAPSPSPDGRFVVYSSARGAEDETLLYVARVSDGVEREIVHNGQNGRPVW
jgi:dipeptidyl aminopeptidase/acylaminoacyl peptidase